MNDALREQLELLDAMQKGATDDNAQLAKLQAERVDIVANAEEQIARIKAEAAEKQLEKERQAAENPDILDNTLARPNYVTDINNFSSITARPGGYTQYGQVRPGDILGAWVFEERLAFLDLLSTATMR